jgi:hypothetical protein
MNRRSGKMNPIVVGIKRPLDYPGIFHFTNQSVPTPSEWMNRALSRPRLRPNHMETAFQLRHHITPFNSEPLQA